MGESRPNPVEGAGDPSMEDILASIRRILNDGEGEGEPEGAQADEGPAHHAAPPPPPADPAEDVFQLDQTMLIEEPAPMHDEAHAPHEASDHQHEPPQDSVHPEPAQGPENQHGFSPLDTGEQAAEPLLAPAAAAATSASLGALVRVVSQRQTPVYRGGPTLEDMVRDELKPMVKAWLDENLAPMVERMVRAEIDRVSKGSA